MATVTGLTAERMLEIEAASVVDGDVVSGNLILTKHDGSTINAGSVVGPQGPQGPVGPASISAIPGEIKMWPNTVLPELATYGKWDWCDGGVLAVASYPIAASHIAAAWKTFGGASDPGAGNFRKPDLRGLVPCGLDAMPGGARANRMTRAVAITIAAKTGEETHVITIPEMAAHNHVASEAPHAHNFWVHVGMGANNGTLESGQQSADVNGDPTSGLIKATATAQPAITVNNTGGNNGHENVQPTVFIPYIVKLDD